MEPSVLLITANLGTLFEKPKEMLDVWLSKFYETVDHFKPHFITLHCQEVGGKQFRKFMSEVTSFVNHMLHSTSLADYDRAAMYLDEDYTLDDNFTALGNIHFVHKDVKEVQCFDFKECKYRTLTGKNIHQGNLLEVTTHMKERFPAHYFQEVKWSRKGYLRTRWKLENITFDLVNVHLFHDPSNLTAMEESPSLYSSKRRAALESILDKFAKDKHEKVPLFIFGDFNFRLDSRSLIKNLVGKAKPEYVKDDVGAITKVVYTENDGDSRVLLSVEQKKFEPLRGELFNCSDDALWLLQYDKEHDSFKKRLSEFERTFPPSYPYSEKMENGNKYMATRVPAWCDRIFLSPLAKKIISEDPSKKPVYNVFGEDVCMGDHKASTKRSNNFSEEEKLALLQFVQHHKTNLLGKAGRPGHGDDKVEERKARYWRKCADVVNAVGGKDRGWKQVRKQWFSLKDKAKKIKGEMGKTGGGPKPNISKAMHLCMEVMARESLEGIRSRTTEVDPTSSAVPEMSQPVYLHIFLKVNPSSGHPPSNSGNHGSLTSNSPRHCCTLL